MGFDWNLDAPDEATAPADRPAGPPTPRATAQRDTAPLQSRRELRLAALAQQAKPQKRSRRSRSAVVRQSMPIEPARDPLRPVAASAAAAIVRKKRPVRRLLLAKILSGSAMLGAGALLVATSVPASALIGANSDPTTPASQVQAQKLAAVDANAITQSSARDKYTVVSLAQQVRLKYANPSWAYTNDPNGTIQWPFPVQVPISSGFGPRQVPGCGFCSTFHEGIDFTPGTGVAIGAIADGVVSDVVESHAGLGNHVVVDHVVNGKKVQSVYAHMLDGSIRVAIGQQVTVTQELGQVGSTGESTGAHLHLEIHIDGVPVDPFAWLKANAN